MPPAKQKNIYRFMQERPLLGERVYIDPAASVSGAVTLGDDVSVWPMAVLRGDVNRISVGARSNIQDGSILHVTHESVAQPKGLALVIGSDVTVGHGAILHACTIGDRCLIGMGAIVMDGVVLEEGALIAGGAVVTPHLYTKLSTGSLQSARYCSRCLFFHSQRFTIGRLQQPRFPVEPDRARTKITS
jgi:carbonic anhydrase/acetyltransferase-like protein (isoleucine patch superfamily)